MYNPSYSLQRVQHPTLTVLRDSLPCEMPNPLRLDEGGGRRDIQQQQWLQGYICGETPEVELVGRREVRVPTRRGKERFARDLEDLGRSSCGKMEVIVGVQGTYVRFVMNSGGWVWPLQSSSWCVAESAQPSSSETVQRAPI